MYTKLIEVQKQMLSFTKDSKNPHFKSSYLSLDNLLAKLMPVCNDLGILVHHKTVNNEVVTVVSDGKESIESCFPLGDTSNPQKIGSYITYAKRYNLGQIFNIMTDEDDDGNKASTLKNDEFGKKNFTSIMLRSMVDEMKNGRRDKDQKTTLEYIKSRYIVNDEMEGSIIEYHTAWKENRLSK